MRNFLKYVRRREREEVARDLKPIYGAANADAVQPAWKALDTINQESACTDAISGRPRPHSQKCARYIGGQCG